MIDVTVLMVAYNEEKYVAKSIDSILGQTYKDFKFLIIDDGSTDNTWKIIKSYRDSRIMPKRFSDHLYLTARLNWGLAQVDTEFFARMDSHNISVPNRLEEQRNFMLKNRKTALVGSNYNKVSENGKAAFMSDFPLTWEGIKSHILERNLFKHASWFARYGALKQIGFYNESYCLAQDYDLLLRLIPKYPVANLPGTLLTEIILPQSNSQKRRAESAKYAFKAQIEAVRRGDYPLWQSLYLLRGLGFVMKSLCHF